MEDDFFTAVIGYASEMGFAKARPLLAYKAKFPVERMTGAGVFWLDGAAYPMQIRDTTTSPFYTKSAQVYRVSYTAEINAMACNSPAMARH